MNSVSNLSLAANTSVGDIAFIDLKAQQRRIRPAVERRLHETMDEPIAARRKLFKAS